LEDPRDLYEQARGSVDNALHVEILELEDSVYLFRAELEKCEKQLVTLQSVDYQLMDDIRRRRKVLHVDKAHVLEMCNLTKLPRI
jgi:hypothetical protein